MLPTAPIAPSEPTGTSISCTMWKLYEHKMGIYETAEYWDLEVIRMVRTKFPNGLTDMELEDGILPLNLPGWMAFDHIEVPQQTD